MQLKIEKKTLYLLRNSLIKPLLFYTVFLEVTQDKTSNYHFIYITMLKLHGKDSQAVLPHFRKFPINTKYMVTRS